MDNRPLFPILASSLAVVACAAVVVRGGKRNVPAQPDHGPGEPAELQVRDEPIHLLVAPPPPDGEQAELVRLGRALFEDPRLSIDGTISCASCHDLSTGGDDGSQYPTGVFGRKGKRNAPTVLNAGLNFRQYWDGRVETLEEQAEGPLLSEAEMGWPDWEELISALRKHDDLVQAFDRVSGSGVTRESLLAALAAFERTLVATGSAFDRWLAGDDDALSPQEMRGYRLFRGLGCIACHQGRNVGGNMYQHLGRVESLLDPEDDTHLGRFAVTGNESDRHLFRVPSLRHAVETAPYLHDGSLPNLEGVVVMMADVQLGEKLSQEEVEDLVAFLGSLPGTLGDR